MNHQEIIIEVIGWTSTVTFLISILLPQRLHLHQFGMFTCLHITSTINILTFKTRPVCF